MIQTIPLDKIVFDPDLQSRAAMNQESIAEYAAILKDNRNALPMPDVWQDGDRYYIGDGWHRLLAHQAAGVAEALCMVHEDGGREAALRHAVGANQAHGVRRTNADKRRSVEIALREWPTLSDSALAELCGVSHPFVGSIRKQVVTVTTSTERTGKDGKTYTVEKKSDDRPRKSEVKQELKQTKEHADKLKREAKAAKREAKKLASELSKANKNAAQEIEDLREYGKTHKERADSLLSERDEYKELIRRICEIMNCEWDDRGSLPEKLQALKALTEGW